MTPRLRTPFRSLSANNFLARGSAGQVFAISRNVVFKCPTLFDNPMPTQVEEMEESTWKLENEKAVYQILMEHRHPNIVYGILCIPEGLFLHRQKMTLKSRMEKSSTSVICTSTQVRWVQQITSALAWIEHLGYVHGDLRPVNIFLDAREDIRLGDFDAAVKRGEQLLVASEPYCKVTENYQTPLAGPVSEQFSLASCIYTIRFGHKPFHDIEAPLRVQKLIMNEFPLTSADVVFGDLTYNCWYGYYNSIIAVEQDVLSIVKKCVGVTAGSNSDSLGLDDIQCAMLRAECNDFLAKEFKTGYQTCRLS